MSISSLENAITLKAALDKLRPLPKEIEDRVMQKLRLEWNYHSNHIEGNQLNIGETRSLILFGITAQGKPLRDHFEITGHDEAIKWVLETIKKERPLNENFIRQIHELILKEPYEVDALTPDGKPTKKWIQIGQYKSTPNHVKTSTGEMFYFASPAETPAKMNDLITWYDEQIAQKDTNPILLAAEFHYRFIRIHPFDDGNGRTARILMNFILMTYGYPPAVIKTEEKEAYYNVLRQADGGNLEPFIEYITLNVTSSLNLMIAGAKGENIEDYDDVDKELALLKQKLLNNGNTFKESRSPKNISNVLDHLFDVLINPYLKDCEKFKEIYLNHDFTLFINNEEVKGSIARLKHEIDIRIPNPSITSIQIVNSFKGFNNIGLEKENYESSIIIVFHIHNYGIIGTSSHSKIYKVYNENLSKEEADQFLSEEKKLHLAKVKELMKKADNNSK